MAAMSDKSRPWVLVRKGKPNLRFASEDEAKRFFDQLCLNRAAKSDGILYGPGKICWKRPKWPPSVWVRDYADRRKERAEVMGDEEQAAENVV